MAKKQVQVVEDDDDEAEAEAEVELEELDDDDEPEEPSPKKAVKKDKIEDDIWGVSNGLIPLIKQKTGKEYKAREVRTLLRKLARNNEGVERDIVAGNKSRYSWSGPDDPEVRVIIKAIKGGQIEIAKKAALDKLKTDKATKLATSAVESAPPPKRKGTVATPPAPAGKKLKAVPQPADDDDDE